MNEQPGIVSDPNHGDIASRIARMEKHSGGYLPSRLVLELAQGGMADHQLDRASRLMARSFDLNPTMFFKPFAGAAYGDQGFSEQGRLSALTDPLTGGPITLDTAKRYIRPQETSIIRSMLEAAIGGTLTTPATGLSGERTSGVREGTPAADPSRVAAAVRAFAPIDGHRVEFSQALAAAISVARDKRIDMDLFARNVQVSTKAQSLPPMLQIAAAQRAAANGVTLHTVADIAASALPQAEGVIQAGTRLETFRDEMQTKARVIAKHGSAGQNEASAAAQVTADQIESPAIAGAEFGEGITQAAGIPGTDFLKNLQDMSDDYTVAAAEIEKGVKVPFWASYAGRGVGTVLNWAGRGLDVTYTALASEIGPPPWANDVERARGLNRGLTDEFDISKDIIMGRTNATESLQEIGYSPTQTAIGEFFAGFAIDPVQVGLNVVSRARAMHTVFGLAEAGKDGEWFTKVDNFVDGNVAHLGGLRNVSVRDYLVTEMDRVKKNPETFFGRAVDNFRTYFSADGIDAITAGRMYRWNTAAKRAGISFADRSLAVGIVMRKALGYSTEALAADLGRLGIAGTDRLVELSDEIEAIARVRTTQATEAIGAQVRGVTADLDAGGLVAAEKAAKSASEDLKQAFGVLDDVAADAMWRMTEIPHARTAVGRSLAAVRQADGSVANVLRSIGTTTPDREGFTHLINIEKPDEAVKDLERAMNLAQFHDRNTIEQMKLELSGALDPANPNRELAVKGVLQKVEALNFKVTNARYGVGGDLQKRIMANFEKHLSPAARDRMVFAAAIDNPLGKTIELNKVRISEIEKALGGELDDAERAALVGEQTKLEAVNRRSERLNREVLDTQAPILASQLKNQYALTDMTLYRAGIAETMGTVRKWERAMRGHFPGIQLSTTNRAVAIPLRSAIDRTIDLALRDVFLTVWKPFAVLRPAYILRVVGMEEQGRFLATAGLMRRVESGKWGASMLELSGLSEPRYMNLGVRLTEVAAQRGNEIEDALLYLTDPELGIQRGLKEGADLTKGTAYADVLRNGGALSKAERQDALRLLSKYKDDLTGIGIDFNKLAVGSNSKKAAAKALEAQARIDAGDRKFPLAGKLSNEPLANNNATRIVLASDDAATSALKQLDNFKGEWGSLQRGDRKFMESWHHVLSAQFGRDPLGRRYLDDIARGVDADTSIAKNLEWLKDKRGGKSYASRLMEGPYTPEELEIQVRRGVEYARALTHDGELTTIAAAARDNVLSLDTLKALDGRMQPLIVHGPLVTNTVLAKAGIVGKVRDFAAHAILQAPTNALSRQPYFKSWYDRVYRSLLETAHSSGLEITSELDASYRATARKFALEQVDRIMFNFSRSARLDDLTRNLFIFVQPFLEFPTVWSRIIRQNPAVLGHVLRLGKTGLASGFLQRDPDTNELVVPLSWWAAAAPLLHLFTGASMPGNGAGGGWSLSAPLTAFNLFANSTFQLPTGKGFAGDIPIPLPSLNPPVQWVLQQWLTHNTTMDAGLKRSLESYLFQFGALGEGAGGFAGLAPAWIRHGLEGLFPDTFRNTVNFNTTHFLQVQQAMGLDPNPDHAQFQSETFSFMRMFFSWVFPASPKVEFPTQDLEDAYRELTKPIPEGGLGYEAGKAAFLKAHPTMSLLTVARSMWNGEDPDDPLRSPAALPANQAVNQLLNTRGAQKFAQEHPQWVWAIIPHELTDGTFDPGTFFAQIASGERTVLSPGEFLASAEEQHGWDLYFAEKAAWDAKKESLAAQGIGEETVTYQDAADAHQRVLDEIGAENPTWYTASKTFTLDHVDPNVMREARQLAEDPMFLKTDVGKALAEYLKMRDSVKHDLADSNLTSLDSTTAQSYGITKRYEDAVAALEEKYPDFATAYRLFFSGDLRSGVKTVGDNLRDALPDEVRPQIAAWESAYSTIKDGPDLAGTDADRNAAYSAIRSYVNQSYTDFPTSQNPMVLHWKAERPDQQQQYLVSLTARSYEFFSRFDKETILGERTSGATENVWTQYDQLRQQIDQQRLTDPNFDSTQAYKLLDVWVAKQARANPIFAEQVSHANTWGYAWGKALDLKDAGGHPVLFDTSSSGNAWASFLDATRQVQAVVDKLDLHGESSFDPRERIVYDLLRTRLADYAAELGKTNLAFAEQWKWLEKENGPDAAISTFVPDVYYPLGGIPGAA